MADLSAKTLIVHQRDATATNWTEQYVSGTSIGTNADKVIGFNSSQLPVAVKALVENSNATGDIWYWNGGFQKLGIGSATQVLQVSGGIPTWQNLAGGHTQNTDVGTDSQTFYIGGQTTSTVKLKNNAGELQVRLGNDSGYANIRVANLVVEGTTTTVQSETITMADNIIVLNSNYVGTSPTEQGGIQVNRGTATNGAASLIWDELSFKWKCGYAGSEVEISLVGHTHVKANITDFNHNLLSTSHPDTNSASSVTQGGLITGQGASPKYSNLATGTSGQYLKSFGTSNDLAWASIAIAEVTGLQTALDGKATGSHVHSASDITSGILAIARGGTNSSGGGFVNDDRRMVYYNGSALLSNASRDVPLWYGNKTTPLVPASAATTGTPGDIAFDNEWFYVCTATNVWRRTPIAIWS